MFCRWHLPICALCQPRSRSARMNVCAPQSSGMPLVRVPCTDGTRPVAMLERFGMQIGFATIARSKRTPRAAMRSRLGVRRISLPPKPV